MYTRWDAQWASVTGRLHTICATDAALTIDDVVLPGYEAQYDAKIAVDGLGIVWALVGGSKGTNLLRNGEPVFAFGLGYGLGKALPLATVDGVEVYLMGPHLGDGTCDVMVYTSGGQLIHAYRSLYSSTGFIDIAPNGDPIAAGSRPAFTRDDAVLNDYMQREGFTVGNSNGGDTIHGSVALIAPTGAKGMAQFGQDIQVPPRLTVGNGRAYVAVTGHDIPHPLKIQWEPFRKYIEQPPLPPVDPPIILPPVVLPPVVLPPDPPKPPEPPLPPVRLTWKQKLAMWAKKQLEDWIRGQLGG